MKKATVQIVPGSPGSAPGRGGTQVPGRGGGSPAGRGGAPGAHQGRGGGSGPPPGRGQAPGAPAGRGAAPGVKQGKKGNKTKGKIGKKGLRGTWLKTAADWARFDEWAAVNALPKKYPEPEPINRPSKPLWILRKRFPHLTRLPSRPDQSIHYRSDFQITKAALKAKPTLRVRKLAWPIVRRFDYGRPIPDKIHRDALKYEATDRIKELCEPKVYISEECKPYIKEKVDEDAEGAEEEKKLTDKELVEKLTACPEQVTPEEKDRLFTERGVRRTALTYTATSWMDVLALPSYKYIKDRDDPKAKKMKKEIVKTKETRGKEALKEQQIKRKKEKQEQEELERKKKEEEEKKAAKKSELSSRPPKVSRTNLPEKSSAKLGETPSEAPPSEAPPEAPPEAAPPEAAPPEAAPPEAAPPEATDVDTEETQMEGPGGEEITTPGVKRKVRHIKTKPKPKKEKKKKKKEEEETGEKKKKGKKKKDKKKKGKGKKGKEDSDKTPEELEEERQEELKRIKNAWRYEPKPYVDDPYSVKRSALQGKASERTEELAKPLPSPEEREKARKEREKARKAKKAEGEGEEEGEGEGKAKKGKGKGKEEEEDEDEEKKGKKGSPDPERMDSLAKPKNPSPPVERKPPREKDDYGRPIFEKPPYGKVMPEVPPYPLPPCPGEDEEEKKKKKKKDLADRKIHPIVYAPTIDPAQEPEMAEFQRKERDKARKIEKARRKKKAKDDANKKAEADRLKKQEEDEKKRKRDELAAKKKEEDDKYWAKQEKKRKKEPPKPEKPKKKKRPKKARPEEKKPKGGIPAKEPMKEDAPEPEEIPSRFEVVQHDAELTEEEQMAIM